MPLEGAWGRKEYRRAAVCNVRPYSDYARAVGRASAGRQLIYSKVIDGRSCWPSVASGGRVLQHPAAAQS